MHTFSFLSLNNKFIDVKLVIGIKFILHFIQLQSNVFTLSNRVFNVKKYAKNKQGERYAKNRRKREKERE